MKHKRNILVPVLVAPALMAFAAAGDGVTFGPEAGTSLTKTFVSEVEVSLDDLTMIMGGQDMSEMAQMEMSTSVTETRQVTDTYVSMGDGQPAKLVRTFDELASNTSVAMSHQMMGDMDTEMAGSSELEGQSVEFTWNEENEEYDVAFADDSDGDEELLEGLMEDFDLRGFLPSGDVSEGDVWEVEPQVMYSVLAPSGSVKIEPEETDEEMPMGGPQGSGDQFFGDFEGEVKAEYVGSKEVDGKKIALIKIMVEVSSSKDMSEEMSEMSEANEMVESMEIEAFDMEYELEGEGQLMWDLEAGVVHSFEVSGEISQVIDMAMTIGVQGQSHEMEQSLYMSGSATYTITAGNDS